MTAEGESLRVHYLRSELVSQGISFLLLAAVMTAFVVVLFDWSWGKIAAGGTAGTLAWGAVHYLFGVRKRLPRGEVQALPPNTAVEASNPIPWTVLAVALPVCFGLAWLVDQWDLGAFFIPGQFAGVVAASLVGAWVVRRWKLRRKERLLVAFVEDGENTLYSVPRGVSTERS